MAEMGKKIAFGECMRWIILYGGTYLLGPMVASFLYWGLATFLPELANVENYQFLYFMLAMMVQTGLGFLLVYYLILRPHQANWSFVGFIRPQKNQIFTYGIVGGCFIFVGILFFSSLITYFQPQLEPQYFETLVSQENSTLQMIGLFLCGSFLAPLTEEMFFRGILYRGLRKYLHVLPAMCLAGLIFGLVHFDAWRTLPLAFGGMALCWIYEKTGSIWVTITAHGLWNAIMTSMVL